jgi:hypothetical protein
MRILVKSKNEYLENEGWSSRKFLHHAKVLFEILEKFDYDLKFARTVIHIKKEKKTIKVRVHYNGRTNDWITFTDKKNNELRSFHCEDSTENILKFILSQF